MRRVAGTLAALLFAALAYPAAAQLKQLETEDLRLIYIDLTQSHITPFAARSFESGMAFYKDFLDYEPSERVMVMLLDSGDTGGGSAGALPKNNLVVRIAPLAYAFETMPPGERMTTIMNHELLHLVSMDQAAGSDVRARRFFRGKVLPTPDHPETLLFMYMTTPRVAVPSWYQEGSAVFMETWMTGGRGRAQSAYYEMVFRSMVRDNARFYEPLGLVSEGTKVDFQLDMNSYLYGTRFMSYLAHEYSPRAVVDWISRTEGTRKYYAAEFKRAFGVSIREAWFDWIASECEFQSENLEAIRQYPRTPYQNLSAKALGSVSSAFFDARTNEIFAAFNYPGVVAHVGSISTDDGRMNRLVDVKAPVIYTVASLAYDPGERKIFYTTDNSAYRDLRVVDPDTGKSKTLMKDARIGDLAFNRADRSLWGVRHSNGYATVVRIPEPYTEWEQIRTWNYGEVVYDLDISPDGRRLSLSEAKINGRHTVNVFDTTTLEEDATPVTQFNLGGWIPNDFVFSPNGRYLYGSSYLTGASNIWRYELATEQLEAVSNTETGFFRPIPLGGDELIVFRYSGEGFVPTKIVATPLEDINPIKFLAKQIELKHPVVRDWRPEPTGKIDLEPLIQRDVDYRGFRQIGLESIYPVVEGYKDSQALGVSMNFSDPMFLNRFSFTTSYSPDDDLLSDERVHAHFKYYRYLLGSSSNWEVNLKWNDADFYDLFGPTKLSRKGYSGGFAYNKNLIDDLPRALDFHIESTYYADMDQLPRYQNVTAVIDSLAEGLIQLSYSNMRWSLGAVEFEKGFKAELMLGATHVDEDLIPGAVGNFDVGFALPLHHSSIWVRSAVGANSGKLNDPFANFYFGGFGNNWVHHGTSRRYRNFFSFPGVELNQIPGRSFVKTMLEWNLPPLRFRNVGSPGFFLSSARTSLFTGMIGTDQDLASVRRKVGNAGVQVDFRFTVMSKFDMTLSLGAATAFEKRHRASDEFMFSLNVLD